VIESGSATVREKVFEFVSGGDALSETCMVKLDIPAAVGVPVILPDDHVKPEGNVPDVRDHEYAPVPPVAANA
jgi:hypothetical protein